MQNARIISDIECPVKLPLTVFIDDPLLVLKGHDNLSFKASSVLTGNQEELMIDEQLYLKRYMNKAVAQKQMEKECIFKI